MSQQGQMIHKSKGQIDLNKATYIKGEKDLDKVKYGVYSTSLKGTAKRNLHMEILNYTQIHY